MIHDGMPYDLIQSQDYGGLNVRKWPIPFSKAISYANMHVIKRIMVNYDTPRQGINFYQTYFDICPHLVSHDFQTLDVHLWQTNFASYEESTGSPVWTYLLNL